MHPSHSKQKSTPTLESDTFRSVCARPVYQTYTVINTKRQKRIGKKIDRTKTNRECRKNFTYFTGKCSGKLCDPTGFGGKPADGRTIAVLRVFLRRVFKFIVPNCRCKLVLFCFCFPRFGQAATAHYAEADDHPDNENGSQQLSLILRKGYGMVERCSKRTWTHKLRWKKIWNGQPKV